MLTTMERSKLPYYRLTPIADHEGDYHISLSGRFIFGKVMMVAALYSCRVTVTRVGLLRRNYRLTSPTVPPLEAAFNYLLRDLPGFYEKMKAEGLL